jgi:hypothetical protein
VAPDVRAPSGRNDRGVIRHQPVRVVLDIERGKSTIRGRLAIDGAPASGFHGWLELIDELERASTHQAGERMPGRRDGEYRAES